MTLGRGWYGSGIGNGYTGGKLDGHFGGIRWEEDVGGIDSYGPGIGNG